MRNYGSKFFWILVITVASAFSLARWGINYGLDLAGGSIVVYKADAEGGVNAQRLEKARRVIEDRVNRTGLSEIYVSTTTKNEILVEMPGRTGAETAAIKEMIRRNGELEFRIVAPNDVADEERARKDNSPAGLYKVKPGYRWVPRDGSPGADVLVEVPEEKVKRELDEARARGELDEKIRAKEREYEDCRAQNVFQGPDLKDVGVGHAYAQIVVNFEMRDDRKAAFGQFTEKHVRRQMAIVLDGKVTSDPVINSPLRGSGMIEGGGVGGFKQKEAEQLQIVLESGSTGVTLRQERDESLGPSLGRDAIEKGKWSVGVGFALIVGLMLWWYRVPGLVAVLALFLNILLMLGALAFFRGALSLPGIAGIVLTLGMAVDSNILIFERLRDERSRGKSLDESLAAGYDRAMSAIIDSNVTTVLTAVVLIAMGTGAVKGFGVTLTIGLLASMFTAIYVTRAVFEWAVQSNVLKAFDIGPEPFRPKLNYMALRKVFTGPSLVLMIAGAVGFMLRDETASKDIEFVGGQQVVVQMTRAKSPKEMGAIIQGPKLEYEGAAAVRLDPRGIGVTDGDTSNRFQIRVKAQTEEDGNAYVAYLRQALASDLAPEPLSEWTKGKPTGGAVAPTVARLNLEVPATVDAVKAAVLAAGAASVDVAPVDGSGDRSFRLSFDAKDQTEAYWRDRIGRAVRDAKLEPSDPFPSLAFLAKGPAESLWRLAVEAVLISLLIQVIYIRLRFADYTHGFAAVLALVHDVAIALGGVALFDALGLVYAKVNLTLIASFLTLIGFSMNDTIVVFDRIRENLGKNGLIRSKVINDAINQTFARSIRTTLTTWGVCLVQFLFNRNAGSVLEGFAWVMVVGCIAGSYSSIFIAAPILLFLPGYGRALTSNTKLLTAMVAASLVGFIVALTAPTHNVQFWIGAALTSAIPLHFLWHFVPWLGHRNPDSLVAAEHTNLEDTRPLSAPGI